MANGRTPTEQRFNIPSRRYEDGTPLRMPEEPAVWMGQRAEYVGGAQGVRQQDVFERLSDARYSYGMFTPEQSKKFFGTMDKYFGKGRWNESYAEKMWARSLNLAAYANRQGVRITPFDALDNLLQQSKQYTGSAGGGVRGGGRPMGPTTFVSEDTVVQLSNPSQARAFLDSALETYLGRRPQDDEYRTFLQAVNAAEEASPVVTRSRRRVTPGGEVQEDESFTRRRGGVDQGQIATEFARSREGYAETSVATTGISAFLELLGS
jgi:hypothetical protein